MNESIIVDADLKGIGHPVNPHPAPKPGTAPENWPIGWQTFNARYEPFLTYSKNNELITMQRVEVYSTPIWQVRFWHLTKGYGKWEDTTEEYANSLDPRGMNEIRCIYRQVLGTATKKQKNNILIGLLKIAHVDTSSSQPIKEVDNDIYASHKFQDSQFVKLANGLIQVTTHNETCDLSIDEIKELYKFVTYPANKNLKSAEDMMNEAAENLGYGNFQQMLMVEETSVIEPIILGRMHDYFAQLAIGDGITAPEWYDVNSLTGYLQRLHIPTKYIDIIVQDYANTLQQAFKKGWEKGFNDIQKNGTWDYVYYRPYNTTTPTITEISTDDLEEQLTNYASALTDISKVQMERFIEGGELVLSLLRKYKQDHPAERKFNAQSGDTICQICDSVNPPWYADNELFNLVNGEARDTGVYCPVCFEKMAKEKGIEVIFKCITAAEDLQNLEAKYSQTETIPINCLHTECPNCHEKVDVIPADGTVILKPISIKQFKNDFEGFLAHPFKDLYQDTMLLNSMREAAEWGLKWATTHADQPFQNRVMPWLLECFGEKIASDKKERSYRFIEEALELVQATGCTKDEVLKMLEYVFNREIGDPYQEVGGVMVTLAALCLANNLNMHENAETELARIWTKIDKIKAKQVTKDVFGITSNPSLPAN